MPPSNTLVNYKVIPPIIPNVHFIARTLDTRSFYGLHTDLTTSFGSIEKHLIPIQYLLTSFFFFTQCCFDVRLAQYAKVVIFFGSGDHQNEGTIHKKLIKFYRRKNISVEWKGALVFTNTLNPLVSTPKFSTTKNQVGRAGIDTKSFTFSVSLY